MSTSSRSTASRWACAGSASTRGDVVALMLTNRPEFHLADTAAMSLGATPFSLYQTLAPEQIAYQVNDSGAEVIVTEPAFLANVKTALADTPNVQHVVLVDGDGSEADTIPFSDLLATEGDTDEIRALARGGRAGRPARP